MPAVLAERRLAVDAGLVTSASVKAWVGAMSKLCANLSLKFLELCEFPESKFSQLEFGDILFSNRILRSS